MSKECKRLLAAAVVCAAAILLFFLVDLKEDVTKIYRDPEKPGGRVVMESGVAFETDPKPQDPPETAEEQPDVFVSVDINRATAEQLADLLPGVGETIAGRIVERREMIGDFRSVDELLEIKGIGPKLLEKIRPYIYVAEAPESPEE